MLQRIGMKRMILGCVAFGCWAWILTAVLIAAVLTSVNTPAEGESSRSLDIIMAAVLSGVTAGVFGFLGVLISSKDDEADPAAAPDESEG